MIDKFIEKAKIICDNDKVKELVVFTSVEATKEQAEYTRYGLDYDKFWKNVDKILTELPKVTINVMATFNALSLMFWFSEVVTSNIFPNIVSAIIIPYLKSPLGLELNIELDILRVLFPPNP